MWEYITTIKTGAFFGTSIGVVGKKAAGIPCLVPLVRLIFVAARKLALRPIERFFLPCGNGQVRSRSSRALDCPAISRRSKGSSPSDERQCWLPWTRKAWNRSHKARQGRLPHRRTGDHQRTLRASSHPRNPTKTQIRSRITKNQAFQGILASFSHVVHLTWGCPVSRGF